MPHEGKSGYQDDAATHQGTSMIASQLSEASRGLWNRPFPQSWEESTVNTTGVISLASRTVRIQIVIKPPSLWYVFHGSPRKLTRVLIFALLVHFILSLKYHTIENPPTLPATPYIQPSHSFTDKVLTVIREPVYTPSFIVFFHSYRKHYTEFCSSFILDKLYCTRFSENVISFAFFT